MCEWRILADDLKGAFLAPFLLNFLLFVCTTTALPDHETPAPQL